MEGEIDLFFDSAEHLCPEGPSVSELMYYDVWMNKLQSVEERKKNFLLEMGFAENHEFSSSRLVEDRLFEESCSSTTNSVEETSISYETEVCDDNGANIMIDELDEEHQEDNKTLISGLDAEENCGNLKESKAEMKRWLSFMRKRKINAGDGSNKGGGSCSSNRLKVKNNKKQWMEFTGLCAAQEIQAHNGIIWSMKFSPDGQFLASGGEDGIVRVWRVKSSDAKFEEGFCSKLSMKKKNLVSDQVVVPKKIFWIDESPLHQFSGHTGHILDLDWSSSNYLLSASSDRTVQLWRVGSERCIGVFRHNDYVTCVQFNPANENYFISGSIDGKVRVWGVSEGRVVDWADVHDVITAICYQPDGKGFVVGSIIGTCHIFNTSGAHLQPDAVLQIQGRKKASNRITTIQFSAENSQRMMITSEDGKIRILDGLEIVHKYRGLSRSRSQLSASFTASTKHIISIGDDSRIYLWNYDDASSTPSSKTVKSDRSCEHFFSEAVSVALPWSSSTRAEQGSLAVPSSVNNHLQRTEPVDSDRFSLGNWFSMEGRCMGAAATWPEEKLPLWDYTPNEEKGNFHSYDHGHAATAETWGLVIVTASLDGKIRAYHNYGLPLRR